MTVERTQVAIVGGGVAGLMLSQLLYVEGISCVVLERQTRAYTENRIRAGVLEAGSVNLLRRAGVNERMDRAGVVHNGLILLNNGHRTRLDLPSLVGSYVMVYGQTEITIDLMNACATRGVPLIFEAQDVALHDFDTAAPMVTYTKDGIAHELACDFIVGCDGFHGVSRPSMPESGASSYFKEYPFGWLGILADVPPLEHEVIYSIHPNGFGLASMRSMTRSRYYIQCPLDTRLDDWPDDRIWDELEVRLGTVGTGRLVRGPSIEKSIAPLRSFVCEKMQHGRLFLCGDAAHIVPPTGAKGLNLAFSDVSYLADALIPYYRRGVEAPLSDYTRRALARIWKTERFSWTMTRLTHRFPDTSDFDQKMQIAELEYISSSEAAQKSIAENYVGLPY